ncbi:hypothetical protein BACPU_25170 [Bacillus pumilus]|nr:hypothetical protein BACPU_25170 [Bacillus pumilus]
MKNEKGFIYPHVLATILFFLLILGSMTIGLQKELASADLTISFYKKQHLMRSGVMEVSKNIHPKCNHYNDLVETEEGRVKLKLLKCDQKKKTIRVLISVKTKDGLADQRELTMDTQTKEILQWATLSK